MSEDRTARFSHTDTAETDAVNIFKYLLNTDEVKFDANERDKIPAVDGDLYLVNKDSAIKGKLLAQVKKLPDRNRETPKKRFGVETLNHYTVDPAPFLLIVVDIKEEIAYWEHIDSDFVQELDISEGQKTKTIHFSDKRVIDGKDESYIEEWKRITEERLDLVLRDENYREAYRKLRKKANPTIGREHEFFRHIHLFLDEFNRLAKQEMPVLNKRIYGNAWKIGFALQSFDENSLHYGLYPIPWERNDIQIKEVDGPVLKELDDALIATGHGRENPIMDRPESYARKKVFDRVEKVLENQRLVHGVNQFLAREYIFEFVDRLNDPLGLDWRQERYSLEDVKKGFYQYLPLWIDEAFMFLVDDRGPKINVGRTGFDLGMMQSRILPDDREEIDRRVRERLEEKGEGAGPFPFTDMHLSSRAFEEFLAYLEQQGVEEIQRPYVPQDYSHLEEKGGGWIWEGYSQEDIAYNLDVFFEHLPEAYNDIVESNFSGIADELPIFDGASKIVFTYELSETYDSLRDSPTRCLYRLTTDRVVEKPEIIVSHDNDSRFYDWEEEVELGEVVEVDDKSYKIESIRTGAMDFLFHDLPMLNYIYGQLGENVGEILDTDRAIFAGKRW